jgi:hypothetical protein
MLKSIFSIYLYFLSSIIYTQNINIEKLISLRTNSLGNIDNFLTTKNWKLNRSSKSTDTSSSLVDYKYENLVKDVKQESSLTFYFTSEKPFFNRVFIQFEDLNYYNSNVKKILQLGFKLQVTSVEENQIKLIYRKYPTTIEVISGSYGEFPSKFNMYSFFICHTQDYNENFIINN